MYFFGFLRLTTKILRWLGKILRGRVSLLTPLVETLLGTVSKFRFIVSLAATYIPLSGFNVIYHNRFKYIYIFLLLKTMIVRTIWYLKRFFLFFSTLYILFQFISNVVLLWAITHIYRKLYTLFTLNTLPKTHLAWLLIQFIISELISTLSNIITESALRQIQFINRGDTGHVTHDFLGYYLVPYKT